MKKNYLAVLLMLCITQSFVAGTTITDSIISGGIYRKYRLYIPSMYTGSVSVPLILNLHGYTSNSAEQMAYSNFISVADTANFLVVHPDGTANNGSQFWNAGFTTPPPDDLTFLANLIDSISASYNIDQQSIYSCGMSNGGIMSYYLACYMPNRIAAIASVTGTMMSPWFSCAPPRPFPVMEIHGTADGTVPYEGNVLFTHIDSIVKKWRIHNNCNPTPITYSVPNTNLGDNSTAVNYKYTGGNNGADVELYKVTGGSHSWPGAFPVFANTNQDFSATIEIWRFFRKYKLNQFPVGIAQNSISLRELKIYPNPADNILYVEGIENAELRVISMEGKQLKKEVNANSLNTEGLPCGLYILEIQKDNSVTRTKFAKN